MSSWHADAKDTYGNIIMFSRLPETFLATDHEIAWTTAGKTLLSFIENQ
jgi:hypothetical protein